jgi:hypothetical protein
MSKKLDLKALAALLSVGIMPFGDQSRQDSFNSEPKQRDSEGLSDSERIRRLYDDVDDRIVFFPSKSETEELSLVVIPQNLAAMIEVGNPTKRRELQFFSEPSEESMVHRLYHNPDLIRDKKIIFSESDEEGDKINELYSTKILQSLEEDKNRILSNNEGLESCLRDSLISRSSGSLSQIEREEFETPLTRKNLEYIVSKPGEISSINDHFTEQNESELYKIIGTSPLKDEIKQNKISAPQYTTSVYSSILGNLISEGYSPKNQDISPDLGPIVLPIMQPGVLKTEKVSVPQEVEVTRQGMQEEYKPVLTMLAKEHPGIQYVGTLHLEDKSQHNVDVLTFEYEENGKKKQMHVVVKDANEVEEKLPQFLNGLGIKTHSVFDINTRLHMQHVGERELRDVVKQASESELLKVCNLALDKMAQIHVTGSAHLPELRQDYGLVFGPVDYITKFKSRFLEPVSGNSAIISPQMHRLMQAYSAFIEEFDPKYLIHGDFHPGNCRITSDECFVYDFEWATDQGEKFRDLSRFVNLVLRDRPGLEPADFTREMLVRYVDKHNEYSEMEKTPFMRRNPKLAAVLRYALIDDQIDKSGGAILFAQAHPKVRDEQMQKCQLYFENTISMLDGAIRMADAQRDYNGWNMLSNLRGALVDFTATSPIEGLRETAQRYQTLPICKEPTILVPS